MMRIDQIWNALEDEGPSNSGLLYRRYSGSFLPNLFVALKIPEKFRGIIVLISNEIEVDITAYDNLKDIAIELRPDEFNKNKNVLFIKLLASEHKDIFSVLCEDLLSNITSKTSERELGQIVLNRFERWKALFNKITSQGLLPEEQRGLFGELFFLRKYLQFEYDYQFVLSTWVGTAKEVRDFQMNNWALEVKTTHGNNHQKVQISSERQLDTTHLDKLFLYHLSLEKVHESGESLNQIIASIGILLKADAIALNRFKSKLYEAGYFDQNFALYDSVGYFIRQDTFYLVENGFPRIQENEIRSGVGDVKYSIILSQCETFKQTEQEVFETLTLQ
ncbi:MAG: PD-(D/E)XK motif protein [Ferruginibacter sp.]